MRARVAAWVITGVLALVLPSTAWAAFPHVVTPGESLSSIAAADGLTVAQLAAANGLSSAAGLITGSVVQIPPQGAGPLVSTAASANAVSASPATGDGDGDSDDPASSAAALVAPAPAAGVAPAAATTPATSGSYVVVPGDTLSAIAARAGTTVAALAAANGLDPNAPLLSGRVLELGGRPVAGAVALPQQQPVGQAAEGVASAPPYPTAERLNASTVGTIGADNGATWTLTDAIAWQESGFNNDLVSSADARGVMQILPGTWAWIQHSLDTGAPLAPASATDNVRGGAIMLHWLLDQTGGDPAMAAAGYFQGLPSVQRYGMFPSTQQYVRDVMALRARFGGG